MAAVYPLTETKTLRNGNVIHQVLNSNSDGARPVHLIMPMIKVDSDQEVVNEELSLMSPVSAIAIYVHIGRVQYTLLDTPVLI